MNISSVRWYSLYWAAYPLYRFAFFLGDADSLGTRGKRRVLVGVLRKQLQKLLWVVCNQLGQLWVASSDLLQNGFKHLWLLLYDLSQLLELWIVTQEIQTIAAQGCTGASRSCTGASRASCPSTTSPTLSGLSSSLEQIYRLFASRGTRGSTRVTSSSRGRRGRSTCLVGWRL